MNIRGTALVLALLAGVGLCAAAPSGTRPPSDDLARGKTLVAYGACNDCHTPGWRASDGSVPVNRWLVGSAIGFRGPWGTVYPANLRERMQLVSESEWLSMIRTRGGHPPMTWHDLRALSTDDQRAIYRFIRALGPGGEPSRPSLAPDRTPTTPYYDVAPLGPTAPMPPR